MKKKGLMIGGICLAVVAGILGYNHEAVRVVFHNVYSPSVNPQNGMEETPTRNCSIQRYRKTIIWTYMCRTVTNQCP